MDRARYALERIDGKTLVISAFDAPTPRERELLGLRAASLRGALAPCAANDASNRVLQLFGLIPQSDAGGDVMRQIRDYGRVLCVEPLWAIDGACRRVVNEGARFRPGAPELLAKARLEARQAREEVDDIEKLLLARVFYKPSEPERSRVRELFPGLLEEIDKEARRRAWKPRSLEELMAWSHRASVELSTAAKSALENSALMRP